VDCGLVIGNDGSVGWAKYLRGFIYITLDTASSVSGTAGVKVSVNFMVNR
jgi:hypothetical protein